MLYFLETMERVMKYLVIATSDDVDDQLKA
jgi:hypothetical protein